MRKVYLLGVLLHLVSCSSAQKQSGLLAEFKDLEVKKLEMNANHLISFRDSAGRVNWEWHKTSSIMVLPDFFSNKYFKHIDEFQNWSGYQECSTEGYFSLNDSSQLLIASNRILNGNEANKYLIKFNNDKPFTQVFLLAKIEKSIDDIFEVYSIINKTQIIQTQIHKYLDGDSLITQKDIYLFNTNDFIHYECIKEDSEKTSEIQ
jgi:hypothetical protein